MLVQFAALPFRVDSEKGLQILLITSRDTRRWVIPKGNAMIGLAGHEAAASEAFEEAGIEGRLLAEPVGEFAYVKARRSGERVHARVAVYPMQVIREHVEWPERTQRVRRWVDQAEASSLVDEPELRRLIQGFTPALTDYAGVKTLVEAGRLSNWRLKLRGMVRALFSTRRR